MAKETGPRLEPQRAPGWWPPRLDSLLILEIFQTLSGVACLWISNLKGSVLGCRSLSDAPRMTTLRFLASSQTSATVGWMTGALSLTSSRVTSSVPVPVAGGFPAGQ